MRATWTGYLKISVVTIPIRVFPATETAGALTFNQLHAECQTRIQQKKHCPTCKRDVAASEIVKGHEFEKGRYVILTDDELEKVKPESTRVVDLVQFADAAALDPMYVDRAYYLAPDGPHAAQAFDTMRAAMIGKIGIGKLALYGREYLVAVRPDVRSLVLYTLHHAGELRAPVDLPHTILRPREIALARQVIAAFDAPLNLAEFRDAYRDGVQQLIDQKIAGEEIATPPAPPAPAAVGNLRQALRASLEQLRGRSAKAPGRRRRRTAA